MLILHCISPRSLPSAMHCLLVCVEQVLKEVALGLGSSLCGVSSSSMGSKEIHYVMRQLGPAMCRNPDLVKRLTQSCIGISLQNGKGESSKCRCGVWPSLCCQLVISIRCNTFDGLLLHSAYY